MSGDEARTGQGCERHASELAELALGVATGLERAEALAHVEACPLCQAEMERLSNAADAMLAVVPALEPPLGFEVRLGERLRAGAPGDAGPKRLRLRRPSLVFACLLALAALGVGVGTGWLARGAPSPARAAFGTTRGGRVLTRSLSSGGRVLGYVTVYSAGAGSTGGWLYMTMDDGSWSGRASCEVRLSDGSELALGTFWLEGGYGAWGVSLPVDPARIQLATVTSGHLVLASADLGARRPGGAGTTGYRAPSGL